MEVLRCFRDALITAAINIYLVRAGYARMLPTALHSFSDYSDPHDLMMGKQANLNDERGTLYRNYFHADAYFRRPLRVTLQSAAI